MADFDRIESGEWPGQTTKDFGLDSSIKVKEEIAHIWAESQDLWSVYCRQMERIVDSANGASSASQTPVWDATCCRNSVSSTALSTETEFL